MRILVTGGAGFIGSNYVRLLADGTLKGASEITVLDNLTYAGSLMNLATVPKDSFRFIHGDINDLGIVAKCVQNIDAVVNFAAESHVDRSISNPSLFTLTNVLGTQTLLEAVKRHPSIRFIQISTDEVYGTINEGSWDESSPLLPNSPYSASKASADLLARSYSITFHLNISVTRCSNNFGPYQYPEKIIPLFITNLLTDKKIPIYGDGSNIRDWLHVDDHCAGIHKVLLQGLPGETYNIAGGREMSNLDLARKILKLLNKGEEEIAYVPDRLGHDKRYSLSYKKIFNELNYIPKIDFEDGLKHTISWYKENRKWWACRVKV